MAQRYREGGSKDREKERKQGWAEAIRLSQSFDGAPEKSWWDVGKQPKGALSMICKWGKIRASLQKKKNKTPLFLGFLSCASCPWFHHWFNKCLLMCQTAFWGWIFSLNKTQCLPSWTICFSGELENKATNMYKRRMLKITHSDREKVAIGDRG